MSDTTAEYAALPPLCKVCDGQGWLLGNVSNGQNAPCWCCGGTGRFDKSACLCPGELRMHSGLMFQERPDSARLDPPVEIVRCRACWKAYRVDGVPYDERARDAEWIAARQAQNQLAAGLFTEEA